MGLLRLTRPLVQSTHRGVVATTRRCLATAPPPVALLSAQELTHERAVEVTWSDGRTAKFHKKWLRDHCCCPVCLHPETKQRQVDTASIGHDPVVSGVQVRQLNGSGSALSIQWAGDVKGTTCRASEFDAAWLRDHAYSGEFHRPYPTTYRQEMLEKKTLWDNSLQVPSHAFEKTMCDIKPAMEDLHRCGLVMIHDTPSCMDETERFSTKIGFVMRTIYGTMWTTNPQSDDQQYNDTASTNVELLHHTDGNYMRDPPGLQIFNCVAQAGEGGDSLYIDSFNVAETLRKENAEAFDFLSQTPLHYHHFDQDAHLSAMEPIIKVDHCGNIVHFRHNDYDRAPLTHLNFDQVDKFYKHHSALMEIMRRPEMELKMKLRVGQMIVVDNHRVLHGRSAFVGSERALIGCYIGRTEYESRLRVLGII